MTDYLDLTTETNLIPTLVASETLGALMANVSLVGLVNRDYDDDVATEGQVVQVGIRGALSVNAKAEGSDVTINAPTSTKVDVTLDQHNEVTFGIEDIAKMIETPDQIPGYAIDGAIVILEEIEADLTALYATFSQSIDATAGLGEDDFRSARRLLNSAKAPGSGRFAVVHEDAEFELLAVERIVNSAYQNSLGSAVLQDSYSGKFAGFNIFMDQKIVADTAGVIHNIFGHRDSMVLATRPMMISSPKLVSQATMSEMGVGLRVTHAYNYQALAEQMTIDILYGVIELRDAFGVVVQTTEI